MTEVNARRVAVPVAGVGENPAAFDQHCTNTVAAPGLLGMSERYREEYAPAAVLFGSGIGMWCVPGHVIIMRGYFGIP
ncbi:hypothetical protein ACH4YO_41460 [Streptomyces noursei]|uniref:hypothetical protein n=1 Tax=Streptomyces noursei TaxID=1971 RepID=UPI003410C00A